MAKRWRLVAWLPLLFPSPLARAEVGPAKRLVVTMVDVGQGDCEWIHFPSNHDVLVDAGDSAQGQTARALAQLRARGLKNVDLWIVSHPHADHYGDRSVVWSFAVKQFWEPGISASSALWAGILADVASLGLLHLTPRAGLKQELFGGFWEVLAPELPFLPGTESDVNNASIVFRLTFGKMRFLFTGDAERESWQRILDRDSLSVRAEVLKVSHHGSWNGTSSRIIRAVQPRIALISVGAHNHYGHPHPFTLFLLGHQRVSTYLTCRNGSITVSSDGNDLVAAPERSKAVVAPDEEVPEDPAQHRRHHSKGRRR